MLIIKGGESVPEPVVVPTASFGVNYALGGGLTSGNFHTFWGNAGSGKTTLALHTMARAQEDGYIPVIVDAERSYTDKWARSCGIDIASRIYIKGNIVEDLLKAIVPLMEDKDNKYIFLFDSLNGILLKEFFEKDEGSKAMALGARSQKALTIRMAHSLTNKDMVIFIAQQSMDLGGKYPVATANMGSAMRHWCTNIIRFFNSANEKESRIRDDSNAILFQEILWTLEKTRQSARTGMQGGYWFSPENASFDWKKEIFHYAVEMGLVVKSGSWFTYGEAKAQGADKLLALLSDRQIEDIRNILLTGEVPNE